ncbi:MAG: type II CRISPR RNA-guided endonuclease Cas9, partial [Phycisphaerae bacterium]
LSFEKSEPLARRAREVWGLDAEAAKRLAELELEPGYARHCAKALRILVGRMEEGVSYATVRKQEFPERFESTDPVDWLPPVLEAVPDVRNPAVCRALTELRKVVNAIIRRHGKPEKIRIELARDLKRPRKQRQEAGKRMRENESRRAAAKRRILSDAGIAQPSASDIEKVLLAEECNWECPYTGRSISMQALLGRNPEFDIEHILPMSRSLDNTYFNKTLCYHEENRNRKHNLMPFEAYGAEAERWHQILERVKRFRGDAARKKLRRFKLTEIPAEWTKRQLQETRYISRLAGKYLSCLYGGRSDAYHTQRIQVSSGGVTAHLRNELMLNSILNDGGSKTRNDHRHHAVDAVAIALAGPAIVKQLADAAQRAAEAGRRLFAPIPEPWVGFLDQVREVIGRINVSRRVNHKISGPLHEESLYSSPQRRGADSGREKEKYRIRKPLAKLTKDEIESIVDPVVREAVKTKLGELNGTDGSVFANPANCPVLRGRDGRERPIRKARICKSANIVSIGQGPRQRYVAPGSNHHMVIVADIDANGQETRWEGHLVSRLEAVERHRRGEPVVKRDWGTGKRFRFTLAPGDMFTIVDGGGRRVLCVVRSISEGRVEFVRATDARLKADIKKAREWLSRTPDSLREAECRKVIVSYLGEIVPCND